VSQLLAIKSTTPIDLVHTKNPISANYSRLHPKAMHHFDPTWSLDNFEYARDFWCFKSYM